MHHDLQLQLALPLIHFGIEQMLKQLNLHDSNLRSQQKQVRQSYIPPTVRFDIASTPARLFPLLCTSHIHRA